MKDLINLQRTCIVACWNGVGAIEEWLQDKFPWFLSLERDIINIDKTEGEDRLKNIGKLWIRWGCVQMKLFATMESLDPQSQIYWENKYLNEEIGLLTKEKELSNVYRSFLTGVKQSDISERCWSEHGLVHPLLNATVVRLNELQKDLSKLSTSIGLRPVGDEKYKNLRVKTLRFLSKYGWNILCDDTMDNVADLDSGFVIEWSMASSEMLNYFLENSDGLLFPDLLEPLALGISRILAGLDMIERCRDRNDPRADSATKICELFCQFPNGNVLDLVETILDEEKTIMKHCRVLIGDCNPDIIAKIHIKLLHLSLRLLDFSQIDNVSDNGRAIGLLFKLLVVFDGLWVKQQKKQLERDEAEASIYVEKQKLTESLTEEEIENLEIFIQVCPNINQNLDDQTMQMSASMNMAASKIHKLRERLESMGMGLVLSEDTMHSIKNLASSILQKNGKQTNADTSVFRDCYRFAAALISANCGNVVNKTCLFASHSAALSWEVDSLSTRNAQLAHGKPYDIYQDPVDVNNILETQQILENIQTSLNQLLSSYPDHTTLLQIQKKVNNILNLSLEYPLIVFINNIERLVFEIQQWEIVAARHVSLIKHIEELNTVLVNWRHQELTMWENTLTTGAWKLERNVSQEFFNYFNLITVEATQPQYENDYESINIIVEPILRSITSATVGNYEAKIKLLELMISSVKAMPNVDEKFQTKLQYVLMNHLDYYKLFLPNIVDRLSSEYKRIGKELKGFIKTKKWGNTPPKVTDVAKCHKIVFKYNRQWTTVINQSCSTYLVLHPINALKSLQPMKMSTVPDCDFSNAGMSSWCEEMQKYCEEMWETMEHFQKETKELEMTAAVDSKIEENVETLEKKWRSNVKNLQQRKRNCLAQFVKELRAMGLNAHGSKLARETALMTHLPLGDVRNEEGEEICKSSAIRCLGLRLLLDDGDKSEEFAKFNDFKDRLVSICDHMLTIACSDAVRINGLKNGFDGIKKSARCLAESFTCGIVGSVASSDIEDRLRMVNRNNKERLQQWSLFLNTLRTGESGKQFPSIIADHLKPALLRSVDNGASLVDVIRRIEENTVPQCYLLTEKHVQCLANQKTVIESIKEFVDVVNGQFSPVDMALKCSITDGLVAFNRDNECRLESIACDMSRIAGDGQGGINVSDLIGQLQSVIRDNIARFQGVLALDGFDMSFTKMITHLDSLDSSLGNGQIKQLLDELKDGLLAMTTEQLNGYRSSINESIVPLLERFIAVENEYYSQLLHYHSIVVAATDALLTVTSKLMTEGFCTPNDSAWQSQDENSAPNEKMNDFDMAGMDDGDGANDVSDQIESESQIEGNDKNKDETKIDDPNDIPDEDNGIEMSEDIDGKLHDPEVDESNEKDGEKEDDKMEDLEDKMGDVGDAPETDVNKEAWDEEKGDNDEADEGEEEKNEDSRKGGVSEENTTEMVADDQKDDKSNDKADNKEIANEADQQEEVGEEDNDKDDDNVKDMDDVNNSFEDSPDNQPEIGNEDAENKDDTPEQEESNPIDDFWNDEEGLEDDGKTEDNQDAAMDEAEFDNKEETVEELKPTEEETTEEVTNNDAEQEINIAGGNDANDDREMTYDTELGEENTENGNSGNGKGYSDSTSTENTQGKIDQNEPMAENKDAPNDQKQDDGISKPSENRTLGDVNKSFKRKADIMDVEENNDNKKPRTTDAFGHIDKDSTEESSDQVLDDATAQQQQHIPDGNEEEVQPEEGNADKDEADNDANNQLRNILEVDKSGDTAESQTREDTRAKEEVISMDEKPLERLSWSQYESKTEYLARGLCENLRIVLEPTKANKLGGAYRTGKRLNMKKVIPYIASGFRKDKIWLRRNKPSQREYQVIIGVDNSKSMAYNVSQELFFESLSIVLNGLTFLEVGQVGLCKFGSKAEVVLPLHEQFSSEIGERLVKTFDFSDRCSKYIPILEQAIQLFDENRQYLSSSAPRETSQLLLLLSDGGLSEDVSDPKFISLIREAHNRNIFVVVILLDHADSKVNILQRTS